MSKIRVLTICGGWTFLASKLLFFNLENFKTAVEAWQLVHIPNRIIMHVIKLT